LVRYRVKIALDIEPGECTVDLDMEEVDPIPLRPVLIQIEEKYWEEGCTDENSTDENDEQLKRMVQSL